MVHINGCPRSGTSWLGQLFDSSPHVRYKYQPLWSRSFRDRVHVRSSPQDIRAYFRELYHYEDDLLDRVKEKEQGIHPVFEEKDEAPECMAVKMVRYHYMLPRFLELETPESIGIGVMRHPCGFLNSWRKAPKEFLPHWDFKQEWRFAPLYNRFRPEEYYGFHRWKEVAKMFLVLKEWFPRNFHLIHYEDLVRSPMEKVEEVFRFCSLNMTDQTRAFVNDSTRSHVEGDYSVYKRKDRTTEWKEELDPEILDEVIRDLEGTELEVYLKE